MATYRKLQVFNITANVEEAVKVVEAPLVDPKPDEVRIKLIYASVYAADMLSTSDKFGAQNKVPYDLGFEVNDFIWVTN